MYRSVADLRMMASTGFGRAEGLKRMAYSSECASPSRGGGDAGSPSV
jgi:hypothetical protein